jgi:hypothetical protein
MSRGEKSKHTDKQEHKAGHIAQSFGTPGAPEKESERRAWTTMNKDDAGSKEPGGPGRDASTGHPPAHKGGVAAGKAAATRSDTARSASAKKPAATRKHNTEPPAKH